MGSAWGSGHERSWNAYGAETTESLLEHAAWLRGQVGEDASLRRDLDVVERELKDREP